MNIHTQSKAVIHIDPSKRWPPNRRRKPSSQAE